MSDMETDRLPLDLLQPGDCFVCDGGAYCDGDLLYFEILEVIPRFSNSADSVGADEGGYRVGVYCSENSLCVEDFYGWDYLESRCVRIATEHMRRARSAGWPRTHAHFHEVFGDELRLTDSRGGRVGALAELLATTAKS